MTRRELDDLLNQVRGSGYEQDCREARSEIHNAMSEAQARIKELELDVEELGSLVSSRDEILSGIEILIENGVEHDS